MDERTGQSLSSSFLRFTAYWCQHHPHSQRLLLFWAFCNVYRKQCSLSPSQKLHTYNKGVESHTSCLIIFFLSLQRVFVKYLTQEWVVNQFKRNIKTQNANYLLLQTVILNEKKYYRLPITFEKKNTKKSEAQTFICPDICTYIQNLLGSVCYTTSTWTVTYCHKHTNIIH